MAGCAASEGITVDGPVTVYVSLPLSGPRSADGIDAADGARLALEQAGGKAADLEVEAEYLDDARGSRWDAAAVGENARDAAEDSSAAAYLGELESQPTRASAPITNEAGIVQVSPGAGAVDLTRPAAGYPDSPDRYRPSDEPRFARVIPADDLQTRAAAEWAQELGATRVRVDLERSRFGRLTAEQFSADAAEVGIEVAAAGGRADLTLSAGEDNSLRLSDGGEHLLAAALDPGSLPAAGFATDFRAAYGRDPGPYAAYGYEAMSLVLQAIAEAADANEEFRDAVVDAVLGAERPESILGRYSITDEGDSTLCAIQRYTVDAGRPVPDQATCPSG